MKNKMINQLKVFSGVLTAAMIFTAFFHISVAAQATTYTFSNTSQINIADYQAANPYPSGITVSGVNTRNKLIHFHALFLTHLFVN